MIAILPSVRSVHDESRKTFGNWRLADHSAGRGDVWNELLDQCNWRIATLRAKLSLNSADAREIRGIEHRVEKRSG